MRTTLMVITLATLVLATAGCDDKTSSKQAAPSAVSPAGAGTTAPEHAPAGAKPGSHEDWCGGHQVPESLCTRCHPSLIPAFKATGDWCEEHALPESQCLICNPELKIERPPPAKG